MASNERRSGRNKKLKVKLVLCDLFEMKEVKR